MQKFTVFLFAAVFFTSGCDFIERVNPFAESTDTMELHRQRLDSIRRVRQLREQQEQARLEQAREETLQEVPENAEVETSERYHLIVGAFKTPAYAEDYHKKMRDNGHDSRIIMSDNNYHLVTLESFDNYRAAVDKWREARESGEHEIWIYTIN